MEVKTVNQQQLPQCGDKIAKKGIELNCAFSASGEASIATTTTTPSATAPGNKTPCAEKGGPSAAPPPATTSTNSGSNNNTNNPTNNTNPRNTGRSGTQPRNRSDRFDQCHNSQNSLKWQPPENRNYNNRYERNGYQRKNHNTNHREERHPYNRPRSDEKNKQPYHPNDRGYANPYRHRREYDYYHKNNRSEGRPGYEITARYTDIAKGLISRIDESNSSPHRLATHNGDNKLNESTRWKKTKCKKTSPKENTDGIDTNTNNVPAISIPAKESLEPVVSAESDQPQSGLPDLTKPPPSIQTTEALVPPTEIIENACNGEIPAQLEELQVIPVITEIQSEPELPDSVIFPKISIIPLARLLRDELCGLASASNIDQTITLSRPNIVRTSPIGQSPSKSITRPNLTTKRRRNISTCSNSSGCNDSLLDKVASMDKIGIKNVINSTGTRYDEALKLQARKRLREEIRKQLKSMNVEPPKDPTNAEFVADDIVDAIHIPEVVLEEIRKAFGIEILGGSDIARLDPIRDDGNRRHAEENVQEAIAIPPLNHSSAISEKAIEVTDQLDEAVHHNNTPSRQKLNIDGQTPIRKSLQEQVDAEPICPDNKQAIDIHSDTPKKPLSERSRKKNVKSKKSKSAKHLKNLVKIEKSERKRKKKKKLHKKRSQKKKKQKLPNEIIVIGSSSESGNTSSSSSSTSSSSSSSSSASSSSSSSSSSSDSEAASNCSQQSATSSIRRRRLKQKVDAENVVQSFEKLILPHLSENLTGRYQTKYNNSTYTKLHFISCICASDYNSEKISKLEIAKIQQNLKADNKSLSLEFLMREIVNVFNKQKSAAKGHAASGDAAPANNNNNNKSQQPPEKEQEKPKDLDHARPLMRPHHKKSGSNSTSPDKAACNNGIEAADAPTTAATNGHPAGVEHEVATESAGDEVIKSKSANAAEKLAGANEARRNDKNGKESVAASLLRRFSLKRKKDSPGSGAGDDKAPAAKHQSVNEQTTLTKVCGAGAGGGDGEAHIADDVVKSAGNAEVMNEISKPHGNRTEEKAGHTETEKGKSCHSKSSSMSPPMMKPSHKLEMFKRHDEDLSPFASYAAGHGSATGYYNLSYGSFITDSLSPGLACLGDTTTTALATCGVGPPPLAYFPRVDLDSLKAKSPIGEAVVNQLRDIDMKLMELHKRKMYIEEMLLKLQKDKMEADLQTVKLQNEKFILLNTAMTANATAAAAAVAIKIEQPAIKTKPQAAVTVEAKTSKTPKIPQQAPKGPTKKNLTPTGRDRSRGRRVRARNWNTTTAKRCSPRGKKRKTAETDDQPDSIEATTAADNEKTSEPKTSQPDESHKAIESEVAGKDCYDHDYVQAGYLEGVTSPITQIQVFEEFVFAAAEDGTLYKYNLRTRDLEEQFPKHSEAITQMYLCHTKKILYTTSLDGYLKKTSIENFHLDLQSLYLQEPLQSIEIRWGVAYVGSRWGNIFTYDIAANKVSESFLCSSNASIIAIKATKEGPRKVLIVSAKGAVVQIRDATTGLLLRSLIVPNDAHIFSLMLDFGHVYCGTQRKEIYKFDFTSGSCISALTCGNGAVSMRLYKKRYIFVGCYDGYIYVLDKDTSRQICRFPGSGKMVLTLEIVGNKVITSAKDKSLEIIAIPDLEKAEGAERMQQKEA